MITVTNEQILLYRQNAARYRQPYGGKFSPFLHSIEKMMRRTKDAEEAFQIEQTEINRSIAAKDKEGFYIKEENGPYRIKAEDEPKRDEKVRELLKKTIEIEPHYSFNILEEI